MANELSQMHSDVPDAMRDFEPGSASRIQSWQSVSSLSSADHPSPRPVDLLEKDGKRLLSEASEIQLWWDAEMCKELKLPPGYRKVAVLLIKWSSEIDEFKERGEQEVSNRPPRFHPLLEPAAVLMLYSMSKRARWQHKADSSRSQHSRNSSKTASTTLRSPCRLRQITEEVRKCICRTRFGRS
jgi:hypothetical protein